VVYSPGTVIISAVGEVSDIRKSLSPVLKKSGNSVMIYIDFSKDDFNTGGSTFAQMMGKPGNETPTVKDPKYFAKAFNTIQKLINDGNILAGHDISAGGMITTLLEMTFANENLGLDIDLTSIRETDLVKILFSENPGIIIQVDDKHEVISLLNQNEINFYPIGYPIPERKLLIKNVKDNLEFDIDTMRDKWFKSSYLLDRNQCGTELAGERFNNYKKQPLSFDFNKNFTGKATQFGIDLKRKTTGKARAAIIREKGVNGDREMAYSLYLAGFDVKDVHMTDLISGRETLEEVNMIVFVGGFSNSDVLGSAKGWAGAFLYNEKAKTALENFYKRKDTLSLGICNGCQLMVELGLIYPDHEEKPKMLHNDSGKFESGFINVDILENNSVMLKTMSEEKLGIWVAHGEGKFELPYDENQYQIPVKYSYKAYPGNPNGSDFSTAAVCSSDGRHLAMMPHLERAVFPWQWAHYPVARKNDEVSPWVEAFVNAREWVIDKY
ncbi:MAG: phosphoribosylformylglycinamidine synthase, partial [Bacteroidetes bacterium]